MSLHLQIRVSASVVYLASVWGLVRHEAEIDTNLQLIRQITNTEMYAKFILRLWPFNFETKKNEKFFLVIDDGTYAGFGAPHSNSNYSCTVTWPCDWCFLHWYKILHYWRSAPISDELTFWVATRSRSKTLSPHGSSTVRTAADTSGSSTRDF